MHRNPRRCCPAPTSSPTLRRVGRRHTPTAACSACWDVPLRSHLPAWAYRWYWAAGFAFAVTNWLTDVVCLWACCRALGAEHTTISLALLAYVAGMAIAGLSLLPGGLGVTDVAIIAAFTHGGLSVTTATAAVLVYRLLSYVLIVAIGWLLWAAHHYAQHRLATGLRPPQLDPTISAVTGPQVTVAGKMS